MSKKIVLFLLACTLVVNAKAQSYGKISWSQTLTPATSTELKGLFGNKDFSFLVFTDKTEGFSQISLVGDRSGQTLKAEHTLAQPALHFIGAFASKDQMVVVLEFLLEDNGRFKQEIKSLAFANGKLAEEKTLFTNEMANRLHLGKTKFAVSPDRQHSLVFSESPYKQGSNEEIKMLVYGGNDEKTYTLSLFIESKQGVHNYPHIANNGMVWFMKRDKDRNQQYRYFVYSYDATSGNLSHKAIVMPGTNITDIRGTVTPQGEFMVGGFTSSLTTHVYEGYFLMKLDAGCMPKFTTKGAFDENTFLKFLSKKEYSKNPVIPNFYIENIMAGPEGKIYIAAEAYEDGQDYYHYNDLMLVCFNGEGAYRTTFKVSKSQGVHEGYTHWASYKAFHHGDTLVTLHNNLVKTEGEKGPEPLLSPTRIHEKFGSVAAPQYGFDTQNPISFFNPDAFMQENEHHFTAVFSDLQRKTFRLARVEL